MDLFWLSRGIPALMAVVFLLSHLRRRHRRLQLWERSTKALVKDSEVETTFLAGRAQVTAQSGPNQVRITDARGQDREAVVEIEGPEGFSVLKLHRQYDGAKVPEIQIGDESFDNQLVMEGPVLAVGARLDEMMRRRLLSAVSGCSSLAIAGGRLRAEVPDEELRRILPILLDIGERLARPVPVERRIAENARRDPFPGVRIFNMLLLARERPGDPETLEVLRDACSDRSPEVRLQAAIELGDKGRGVLLSLAETSVHDASAAQAVTLLGSTLSFEKLQEILARAVRSFSRKRDGLLRTARASMEEFSHRGAAAVGVLAQVVTEQKGELAAAAARALGATGEASAEAALLQALESGEDADLWVAAATALGRVGTAAAVQPLKEAAERSWIDRSLRRAARQAISEIQSRLEGAAPGQLSLAGAEGGQLSLAVDGGGQLALAVDGAGGAGELAVAPHETSQPTDPSASRTIQVTRTEIP
jgi:hypothetical protein